MAPAAMMTSFRAYATYRVEPPAAGAKSIPVATRGRLLDAKRIFVTYEEKILIV
jgi:hypothetical protein